MRLLVVEDDRDLNRQLVKAFEQAGYAVDEAFDGEEGEFLGETEPYDAVVLDIGLPGKDGVAVLEAWRKAGRKMPVLVLTARDRWSEKVQAFDAGADDYLGKPFDLDELAARLRVLVRRGSGRASPLLTHGGLALDPDEAEALAHGGDPRRPAPQERIERMSSWSTQLKKMAMEAIRRRHPKEHPTLLPTNRSAEVILTRVAVEFPASLFVTGDRLEA
jgi:two-component system OmpR family response regulator